MRKARARAAVVAAAVALSCKSTDALTVADVAGEYTLLGSPSVSHPNGSYTVYTEAGTLTLRADGTMTIWQRSHTCGRPNFQPQVTCGPSEESTSDYDWALHGDSIHYGMAPDLRARAMVVVNEIHRCIPIPASSESCGMKYRYARD